MLANRQQATILGGLLASLLITFLVFRPALFGPFVLDDLSNISLLAQLGGEITRHSLGQYLFSFSGDLGRPLSALSFLIEDSDWPTDPAPYKRNNLLLHALNGLLIFLLFRRLLLDSAHRTRAELMALAVTAMWLIQPMQVASVMATVQRMNLLSSGFILAGLVLHVVSLQAAKPMTSLRAFGLMARLGAFSALAFLCKENGALLPLLAASLHATVLRTRLAGFASPARRLLVWGALAPWVLIVAYAISYPPFILGGYGGRDFGLLERLLSEARILWSYVAQIAVPRISGHSVFHDDYIVSTSLLSPLSTLPSVIGWGAAMIAAVHLRLRQPWVSFAIAWFLAAHLMESTFIGLELYFEHRNYLAMLGPLMLLVLLLNRMRPAFAMALLTLWLAMASLSSWSNAQVWSSSQRMAAVWHLEHPDSVRAIQMRASELAQAGEVQAAISLLEAGYRRMPERAELLFQTIPLRCGSGMSPPSLPDVLEAASKARTPQIASSQLVTLRRVAPHCGADFTLDDWWKITDALLANPLMRKSSNAISHTHYQRGQVAVGARDLNLAMTELDMAYQAEPNPFIPREQATYLMGAGLLDDAERYLDRSEGTEMGQWKRWLLDPVQYNLSLRETLHLMRSGQAVRAAARIQPQVEPDALISTTATSATR